MELRHLRYFVAVAETENVSRAALKLHISQPALSRQIRDLEDEIGFPLLRRTAKSVSLTDAGRVFLREVRLVLQRADEAISQARAAATGAGEQLNVGYSPTPTARILTPTLRAFQKTMPSVRVVLHDLSNQENLSRLREGRLHLAFIVRPRTLREIRGLRFVELTRDPVRLAVSRGHALARRSSVPLTDALRETFVTYARGEYPDYHELLAEVFGPDARKLRIAEEHDGVSSLITAVEAGRGVALTSDSLRCMSGNRLRLLRLTPEPRPLATGLAVRKSPMIPSVEAFRNCAQEVASRLK